MSLPPLPPIEGEMMLEIFTHRDLSFGQNEEFGDSERLSVIGQRVLAMVVSVVLFEKRPMLSASDLKMIVPGSTALDDWVTQYGLRKKVRCAPDKREDLNGPEETELLFTAYVGGVYLQRGWLAVAAWIGKLVDPESDGPSSPKSEPMPDVSSSGSTTAFSQNLAPPPPPLQPPPPLPEASKSPAFLAMFNQMCAQRRIGVEWPAVASGPSHSPSWTVECVVDGISRGRGAGKNKQLAKEDAAKQAYYAMGWCDKLNVLSGNVPE
ncbi:hypothetical protein BV25DRAFT_1867295 [Artomyces pyxidatus]|uniref:Uncharacterized protein n=1 Tax=Artomyces pyxidatus TaxID=48021 RepID=A0ACB8TIM8_9AGAM|nr:hypothetical protein BV25DRAFT_1867295 [Artomyces pyxidatus]